MDEKITILDETRKVVIDVGKELSVEYATLGQLNRALSLAPGKLYYYGRLLKDLTKIVSLITLNAKTVRAGVYQATKTANILSGNKITEEGVKSVIQMDPNVQKAETSLIEAEANQSNFKNLIESFRKRQESIIEISRNIRGEANLRGNTNI